MFGSKIFLAGMAGLAMGLFLGGCDSAESNPAKAEAKAPIGASDLESASDFDRDLITAKQTATNDADRIHAIEAVLSRYGVPYNAPRVPEAPQSGPLSEAPAGAAKSASALFRPYVRDFTADNDIHSFSKSITVAPSQTVTISATADQPATDPFLVAFYRDDPSDNTTAYVIKVVGLNDDIAFTNRNSLIKWTNSGSTSKKIQIVAFNSTPANRGTAMVEITLGGATTSYPSRYIGGTVEYGNPYPDVPANCSPSYTSFVEKNVLGGGYHAAALVVDASTKVGGIIWDSDLTPTQTLAFSPLLNRRYPSFGLLLEADGNQAGRWAEEASGYRLTQRDVYTCTP
jgi:hypothetical protein